MARFLDPTYDPRQDSGTSGGDTSDLHPERAYDTDIRRLDETARDSADAADTRNEVKQDRVKKYMAAAKTAGPTWYTIDDIPMLRMNFDPSTTAISDVKQTIFNLYPNPSNGVFVIVSRETSNNNVTTF